ncbi:MAG: HAD family hydrolase [Anaerolineales bacterium]|nr:HAD family hydrolase [Anaerolineales bacterium]
MITKKYEAIFFDWDGTAVVTRDSPIDEVIPLMTALLEKVVVLCVISGTTYNNIAGGKLHEHFSAAALRNLYLGLARGAFDYGFDVDGNMITLHEVLPDMDLKIGIHRLAFAVHMHLLNDYGYDTDVVFTRPNYCKIDLLVNLDRMGKLFLQPGELDLLNQNLNNCGYEGGITKLIEETIEMGRELGIEVKATTDAKFLEVGMTTKADNVDYLLENVVFERGIPIENCCFWGDELTYLGPGVRGSDAEMITAKSRDADFFDVSEEPLELPEIVHHVGGGVTSFLEFLESQVAT